jgi:hypothetical protein
MMAKKEKRDTFYLCALFSLQIKPIIIYFFFKKKMPYQFLAADCLHEIFEFLEKDKTTLYSCLLVNRLLCEVSVRILWKDIWNFQHCTSSKVLSTLVACLPDESKDLLYNNGIIISTPTSK